MASAGLRRLRVARGDARFAPHASQLGRAAALIRRALPPRLGRAAALICASAPLLATEVSSSNTAQEAPPASATGRADLDDDPDEQLAWLCARIEQATQPLTDFNAGAPSAPTLERARALALATLDDLRAIEELLPVAARPPSEEAWANVNNTYDVLTLGAREFFPEGPNATELARMAWKVLDRGAPEYLVAYAANWIVQQLMEDLSLDGFDRIRSTILGRDWNDPCQAATALSVVAECEAMLGDFGQSEERFRTARRWLERCAEDDAGVPSLLVTLREGNLWTSVGMPDRAEGCLRRARGIWDGLDESLRWPAYEAELLSAELDVHVARDDPRAVLTLLDGPLSVAEDDPETLFMKARSRGLKGEFDAGRTEDLRSATGVLRELLEKNLRSDLLTLRVRLHLADFDLALLARTDVAGERAEHAAEARRAFAAAREQVRLAPGPLQLNDRVRMASVGARLALSEPEPAPAEVSEALERVEGTLEQFLDACRTVVPASSGHAFLHFTDRRRLLSELARLYRVRFGRTEGARRALERILEAEELGSLAQRLGAAEGGARAVRLEEFQARLLRPDRVALLYLPASIASQLFVIGAHDVDVLDLASCEAWTPRLEQWGQVLADPQLARDVGSAQMAELATAVADALLPSALAATLGNVRELYVIGSENVGWIPFESLRWRGGLEPGLAPASVTPMGERFAVAYLPSLALGCRLARRADARNAPSRTGAVDPSKLGERSKAGEAGGPDIAGFPDARVAVFPKAGIDARTGQPFPPIPWTDAWTERALQPWSKGVAQVDWPAAPDILLGRQPRSERFLCVVAHGRYEPTSERPASIAAGPELQARCEDIESAWAPPTVELLVCGAGRGPLRRGDDGISSLAGAFLSAGSDCVVLSPVDLAFQASVTFSALVHEHVARGASIAVALQEARRASARESAGGPLGTFATLHAVGLAFEPSFDFVRTRPRALQARGRSARILAWLAGALCAGAVLGRAILRARRSRTAPLHPRAD